METEDKKKTLAEELNERIDELVLQATEADQIFVDKIKQPGFYSDGLTVTPVQSALILKSNGHNRRVSNPQLDVMIGILSRGDWKRTHQGMAFYKDGSLMDAQHRLGASVLTDIPLSPIMVSGGYDKEDNDAIDAGTKRTAADTTALAGIHDAALKCYMVNEWLTYEHRLNYGKPIVLTNHQIKEKVKQHDTALKAAISLADRVVKSCAIAVMSRKEIAARAFEMTQGGWSPVFAHTMLTLVNQGTADYDGAPTVHLSDAYRLDREDKAKHKLTTLQRQAMWHKASDFYAHKKRVTKTAVAWKMGNPVPSMTPASDIDQTAAAAAE
jgi:hypothetical protein